jgi:hypothetical protein
MSLGRIALAWGAVAAWLLVWRLAIPTAAEAGRSRAQRPRWQGVTDDLGEALVVTLWGALWLASLGAGAWWLPFLLVALLREWPVRSARSVARVGRMMVAGGLLAWTLPS